MVLSNVNFTPVNKTVVIALVGMPLGVPMCAWTQTTGLVPVGILNLFHEVLLIVTPGIVQADVILQVALPLLETGVLLMAPVPLQVSVSVEGLVKVT